MRIVTRSKHTNAIEKCFFRSIFHLLPDADRLGVSSFPFSFFFFQVFLAREVIATRFSTNVASDPIPDGGWCIGCGVSKPGHSRGVVHKPHDRRHYRWWVAPRDQRNWFRERPIASTRDRSRIRTSRVSASMATAILAECSNILFNFTWAQM